MRQRASDESAIQRTVFQHLAARASPGVYAFHVPNGGYRRPKEAAILKGLGVKPGIPDVMVIYQGRVYAIEIKAENGRPTEAQLAAVEAIRDAGGHACICYGLDRVLATLEAWQILRGRIAA